MPKKGAAKPYNDYCGVDEYAAPFGGGMGGRKREVKRMGAHSDIKAASHHDKGRGSRKSGY